MSLILKGIDLPKGYGHIHLEIYPNGDVEAEWDQDSKDYRAIQIPKGHGRLIDASTETTVKSMSGKAMDVGMLLIALKQYVPTIFEAEE